MDNKTVTLMRADNFKNFMIAFNNVSANSTINLGKKNMTGTVILDGNNIENSFQLINVHTTTTGNTFNIYDGIVLKNHKSSIRPAFYIYENYNVNIYGIEISNCSNSAKLGESNVLFGGAIVLSDSSSKLVIYNANIHDCSSTYGGAIYLVSGNTTIYDANIYNNTANFGGGIYIGSYVTSATIYNANVHNCTATVLETVTTSEGVSTYAYEGGQGGGVYIASNSNVNIYKMTVEDNTAVYGGGIYLDYGRTLSKVLGFNVQNQITVVGNSAIESYQTTNGIDYYYVGGMGGGIYSRYQFHLSYAIVANNTASVYGGGIYEEGLNGSDRLYTSTIDNSAIYGNMVVNLYDSDVGGGAIYMHQMTLTNVEIYNNGILNLYSTTATVNMYGGAIYGVKGLGLGTGTYSAGGNKTFINCNIYDNFINSKYSSGNMRGYGG
ncbi:MAG: hypothetical protein EOM05_11950, partial [Clostridia bacterium]|nr:hypothetical protein [Clostridia bacterium]